MKKFVNILLIAGLLAACGDLRAQEKTAPDVNEIPTQVMDCLKAKFPHPRITKWTKEKEGEMVLYDIEFTRAGKKFEADIREDGTIHNWERAISAKDLPAAVRKAVDEKYPKASLIEIMEITAVKEGKDELEGYEIVLRTADKKNLELTVAPDGKILEEPATPANIQPPQH